MLAIATSPAFSDDLARLDAVRRRDPASDGAFVFSVRTTGVYCRPTCPARPALASNIAFHAGPAEAEAAGFRACRRCRPEGASPAAEARATVAAACRRIERAESPPSLATLATAAGLSAFHFHRLFKATTGVTPRAYAAACRAERLRQGLAHGGGVTAAGYEAGFNASSRLYAATPGRLGMTPGRFRAGGAGERVTAAVAPCSLGRVLVAGTARGLCAILLGDDDDTLLGDLRGRFPRAEIVEGDPGFASTVAAAVALVEAPARPSPDLPLDIRGTAFQQRVWAALRAIPPGTTASYTDVAARLGQPAAVRAVAGACAANPLAVAIPCHRVVGRNGNLSGYRWGLERKRALLRQEGGEVPGTPRG